MKLKKTLISNILSHSLAIFFNISQFQHEIFSIYLNFENKNLIHT